MDWGDYIKQWLPPYYVRPAQPQADSSTPSAADIDRARALMARDYGNANATAISRGHLSREDAERLGPPSQPMFNDMLPSWHNKLADD